MVTALAREELRRAAGNRPVVLTIGVFDGVHRGHQALLNRVMALAATNKMASAVITFHPHPRSVIHPDQPSAYLTSFEDRLDLLRGLGLDDVAPVTFTSELAQAEAEDFIRLVVEEMRLAILVIGPDFALGRHRGGDVERLRSLGEELQFTVEVIDLVADAEAKVSSTEIRRALADGDVGRVAELLGRPFTLHGPVVVGFERGQTIGFPTANIAVGADRALPAAGVYATVASFDDRTFPSVSNIGVRPTFNDDDAPSVECHIFDFEGDLYHRDLRIELVERLRGERKFADIEALKVQISKDAVAARKVLALRVKV